MFPGSPAIRADTMPPAVKARKRAEAAQRRADQARLAQTLDEARSQNARPITTKTPGGSPPDVPPAVPPAGTGAAR